MKIIVYPADDQGCGHYRMILPALALAEQGHHVEIDQSGAILHDALVKQPKDDPTAPWEIIKVKDLPEADVVVLQRPSHPALEASIRFLRKQGIQVVVDIDDRFDAIPAKNMAFEYYSGPNLKHLLRAIDAATVVTCSTPDLVELHDGVLIDNCIPKCYLDIVDDHDDVIGWSGTILVHGDDLAVGGAAVGRAVRDSGWKFRVVGQKDGVRRELGLDEEPDETGWLRLGDYALEVAKLGIGIAPLVDNRFNRSKSWLKALEYGALGVPCVTSPLPEYERLGIGLRAANQRQWRGAIMALTRDAAMREDLRLAGRAAARQWTFEGNAHKWAEVWEDPEGASKRLRRSSFS